MHTGTRIIITGGPGFGKTTLIGELERSGFHCVHESSREIIHQQLQSGGQFVPWLDLQGFSEMVFERRLQQFRDADQQPCFFDRGIPDIAAYMELAGLPLWPELLASCQSHRYHEVVFLTPPWPEIFRNDSERKESFDEAVRLHEAIRNQYQKLGYRCLEIPPARVSERAAFVLEQLATAD